MTGDYTTMCRRATHWFVLPRDPWGRTPAGLTVISVGFVNKECRVTCPSWRTFHFWWADSCSVTYCKFIIQAACRLSTAHVMSKCLKAFTSQGSEMKFVKKQRGWQKVLRNMDLTGSDLFSSQSLHRFTVVQPCGRIMWISHFYKIKGAVIDFFYCILIELNWKICRTWLKTNELSHGLSKRVLSCWESMFGKLTAGWECLWIFGCASC